MEGTGEREKALPVSFSGGPSAASGIYLRLPPFGREDPLAGPPLGSEAERGGAAAAGQYAAVAAVSPEPAR